MTVGGIDLARTDFRGGRQALSFAADCILLEVGASHKELHDGVRPAVLSHGSREDLVRTKQQRLYLVFRSVSLL